VFRIWEPFPHLLNIISFSNIIPRKHQNSFQSSYSLSNIMPFPKFDLSHSKLIPFHNIRSTQKSRRHSSSTWSVSAWRLTTNETSLWSSNSLQGYPWLLKTIQESWSITRPTNSEVVPNFIDEVFTTIFLKSNLVPAAGSSIGRLMPLFVERYWSNFCLNLVFNLLSNRPSSALSW